MSVAPQNQLSLRTRLTIVAVIALVLSIVPGVMLIAKLNADLQLARGERAALPLNQAWQGVLGALRQQRRLGAEALSTRPAARDELPAARQAVQASLAKLEAALGAADFDARHRAAAKALGESAAALNADFDASKLDLANLLGRQQALAAQAFAAMSDLDEDSGLNLEPGSGLHPSIAAGLESAPRVEDALSELGAIAAAAAVDDIGLVNRALTRYREHSAAMLAQLRMARAADAELGASLAPLIDKADAQRRLVDDTLAAAAKDVNYPLDKLAATFRDAAALQAEVSGQVQHTLADAIGARERTVALRRNLIGGLLPLALVWLVVLMRRALKRLLVPVEQMIAATERIAAGDLSQPVPAGGADELGRVLRALGGMQERLRGLIEQIHGGATNIRSAAREIAAGNEDLAGRTEQAAAELQRTTANVELLDGVVQQTSRAAGEASTLAQRMSGYAKEGGSVVGEVVGTMEEISASSRRIADITGLIDGIAFQTNILALNAAVEAARAGEQGRGFAVVAAEVRSLAQRSAEAAKEIKVLIQQSVERVENGSQLAGRAGAAMQGIVEQVEKVAQMIGEMEGSSREQAGQTAEVGRAVRSVDAMTQSNAALVEQSAAAAASLRGQAEAMDETVQAFRL
ncbi:MAG: HAMP domain-containing protein [Pelomonas sp.]|nr:HAMP domain-containing protein [Roseateles sp.]